MFRAFLLATAAAVALAPTALAQTPQPAPTPPAQPAPAPAPGTEVQGVTVTGRRPDVSTSIDSRVYNVANDLQATSGSVADALRNVPSVEVDVQGNVSLRGDPNVRILIDGRPSGLFNGEGRADALQQLPADQVERIEVMTNPSAAFSPEGSGGVINLVTRRNRRAGQFGSVRANIGTGGRYNGGVSGAYNSERLTLTGDAGFRVDGQNGDTVLDRRRNTAAGVVESRQRSDGENEGRNYNARVAADYNPDANNRLSAEARFNTGTFEQSTSDRFEEEDTAGALARVFERRALGEVDRTNMGASASWRRTFSGEQHELSAELYGERTDFERTLQASIVDTLPVAAIRGEDIRNGLDQDQARVKVDYNRPLADGARLRTGYEMEYTDSDFAGVGRRGAGTGPFPIDPNLTDRFLYEQTVNAAYATYQRPFGDLTVQAGLRVKQVNLDLSSVSLARDDTRDDTGVYPTLHLAYTLTPEQQLTASYSRRIQRPRAEDLNPFIIYLDPFNLRAGNPDLEAQVTDSFEAGWQYRRAQTTLLATAYFRTSDNGVTDVIRDLGNGVFLTTRENLSERQTTGLELVANGRLSSQWTYNISGNVFHEEISAASLGFTQGRDDVSWGVRGSLNWQPTPNDFIQISAFGNGRRLLPQGYREPNAVLNLGYRRKVNDQLSLVGTVRDVFDSLQDTLVIETPEFQDRIERRFAGRALYVGFTYSFGATPPRQREPGFEFDGAGGPPAG